MLFRRLLLLLVALGLAAGALVLTRRPQPGPTVELALDYTSARRFAARLGLDLDRVLADFRAAGVGTLLVGETSLYDLLQQGQMGYPGNFPVEVAALTGPDLLAAYRMQGLPVPAGISREESYVFIRRNPALAAWLEQMLTARLGPGRVRAVSPAPSESAVLGVRMGLNHDSLLLPLGILPADAAVAERHGFRIAAALTQRPPPLDKTADTWPMRTADPAAIAATLPPGVSVVYIRGREVPGYPEQPGVLGPLLREGGAALAIQRDPRADQPDLPLGLAALAEQLDLRAVKAYRLQYGERVSDWVTAVKDRSMRFLIYEPVVLSADGTQDLSRHLGWLQELNHGISAFGLETGPAQVPTATAAPAWAVALVAVAAVAGLLELGFRFWVPGPHSPPAVAVAVGAAAVAALAGGPLLVLLDPVRGAQVLAFGAAVAFPALGAVAAASRGLDLHLSTAAIVLQRGAVHLDRRWRTGAAAALSLLVPVVLWSAAGALLVHALLADHRFWLELALFRGVNPALLGPPAVLLAYWAWHGREKLSRTFGRVGGGSLRFGQLLAGALVLGAVAMLVVRNAYAGVEVSGLNLAPVSQTELLLRTRLEEWLYARPRTKELLLGYPAFFAAAYLFRSGRRSAGLVAVAVGALAGASVVNTFAHAHSPTLLSALRSFHGLWLGLAAGGLLLAILSLWRGESHA